MNRKIIYIILVALFIFLLMALLWWWFLNREQTTTKTTGTFGTAQNIDGSNGTGGAVSGPNNIGMALPGQPGATTQTNIDLSGAPTGGTVSQGNTGVTLPGQPTSVGIQTPGGVQTNTSVGVVTPTIVGPVSTTLSGAGTSNPTGTVVTPTSVGPVTTLPGGTTTVVPGTVTNPPLPGTVAVGTVTSGPIQVGTVPAPVIYGQVGVPDVVWLAGIPVGGTVVLPDINYNGTPSTSTVPIIDVPAVPSVGATTTTTISNRTNTPGTVFNPIGINQIAISNPIGTGGVMPNIGNNEYGQQTGGGDSALGSIAAAAGVGVVTCAVVPALQAVAKAIGLTEGTASGAASQAPATAAATAAAALSVSTIDIGVNTSLKLGIPTLNSSIGQTNANLTGNQTIDQFMGCLTRNIAKIALQQITNSVVNWINSGFNGSPSFVQNPTKFLQQTADKVAGSYIQSSALSFLCSPFQLQVRIAIAQSYANRSTAPSCSLTQVSNNINNFMRGAFSKGGGWPAFIRFTTIPTNNPYGAFLYGSAGLSAVTSNAQGQVRTDLLQGQGFLSFQKKTNCSTQSTASTNPNQSSAPIQGPNGEQYFTVCDLQITTPGHVIADALGATEKSSLDQLTLAKSFDEIINALISQLMTRTLQGGLSNLSGAGGYASNFYTPDQTQTQNQLQALVTRMQGDTAIASQYASIQQDSIGDIEDAQGRLNDLFNCWNTVATSSSLGTTASTSAAQASTTLNSLNPIIDGYNNRITLANNAIVALEGLQSRALSAASTNDISSVTADYNAAKASGTLPSQADVTNAQQNRTTLQSQMSALNQRTQTSLQQCYAVQ